MRRLSPGGRSGPARAEGATSPNLSGTTPSGRGNSGERPSGTGPTEGASGPVRAISQVKRQSGETVARTVPSDLTDLTPEVHRVRAGRPIHAGCGDPPVELTDQGGAHAERGCRRHHPPAEVDPAMTVSVFDLFSIGIGPSSSHTVGPMRAANRFVADLDEYGLLDKTTAVDVRLYGSLAATGVGHGTVPAVLVGLTGRRPEVVTPEEIAACMTDLRKRGRLELADRVGVPMSEQDVA